MSTVGFTITPECLRNINAEPVFIDSTQDIAGYAFANSAAVSGQFNAFVYGGGNVTFEVRWYSRAGNTTGNVRWDVAMAAITPGDAVSTEGKSFAAAVNATTTVNATAKGETLTSLTISGASLDSLAAGDDVWFTVTRNAASTLTGDAVVVAAVITYSDGVTGSPGSGDVVGPASATADALARYDLTTGKLIKNSPVICDASGNLTGLGTLNTRTIANWVDGPASATSGRVAVYNGTTGKLVQDGTKLETDLVTGPASAASGSVVTFNGTSGKVVQDSGLNVGNVVRNATGTSVVGNVVSYNSTTGLVVLDSGVAAASVVVGPASSTSGRIAVYNGTTGKLLQNGTVLEADVVTGPASVTTGRVASYNGTTGKIIQQGTQLAADLVSGPASATSGNIAALDATGKILSDSGVSATAHEARHDVGGADTLFPGTYVSGDSARWNGSAWAPKFQAVSELTSNFSVTTGTNAFGNITGVSIALPRAGTYKIYASGLITLSGTIGAGGSSWCFKYSGTTTRIAAAGGVFSNGTGLACYLYLYQSADGALTTQTGSGTTAANQQFHLSGSITVSTTGNLTLQVARNGTPTASVVAGTAIHVVEL